MTAEPEACICPDPFWLVEDDCPALVHTNKLPSCDQCGVVLGDTGDTCQACTPWSAEAEAWIREATIALTYTPIVPGDLYRWPGHSGLTLDSRQARDGAVRVLAHLQGKGIEFPTTCDRGPEAPEPRVTTTYSVVFDNMPGWGFDTARDAAIRAAARNGGRVEKVTTTVLREPHFGPGDPEFCPSAGDDGFAHCGHWYECEPCHWCGDDTPDPNCDCPRCTAARDATASATPEPDPSPLTPPPVRKDER